MSNETLLAISHTPLWQYVAAASQDQHWWFARTEWLVGRKLTQQAGNWKSVYNSLVSYGVEFNINYDYSHALLVSVLLEAGADPYLLVLRHVRTINDPEKMLTFGHKPIELVIRDGNCEAIKLMLALPHRRARNDGSGTYTSLMNKSITTKLALDIERDDIVQLLLDLPNNQKIKDTIDLRSYGMKWLKHSLLRHPSK